MSEPGDRRERDLPGWVFAGLAVLVPLVLFAAHHDLGHQGDLRFFYEWFRAFQTSIYLDGPGANYPMLGVLVVCLPARLAEVISGGEVGFEAYRLIIKSTLVLTEVALVFALVGLARALDLARPRLLAAGIYLLPSTWAGGAWFGQIDVVATLLLVLSAWGFVRYASSGRAGWIALGLAGLHGAVLTKQLTFFSIPGLALLMVLGIVRLGREGDTRKVVITLAASALSCLVWFLPDLFLALPDGHVSHLAFVLFGGGSAHADVLSGNGANLWAIVSADPSASALDPVFLGLSSKVWGIMLFGLAQAGVLAWLGMTARGGHLKPVHLVVYVGLSNLAMATLLTGVHERYLVHGVPFLILGLAGVARTRWPVVITWVVGAWSGLFVLSSIHWETFSGILLPFRSHTLTGILELGLLIALGFYLGMARPGARDGTPTADGD